MQVQCLVEQKPNILEFVNPLIKKRLDIVKIAYNKDHNSLKYASKEAVYWIFEE